MARRQTRYKTRGDNGSAWISYSDMMAALLLLFVLVLCYSVYQYFAMLESKTAELQDKELLLNSQQITLDQQQGILLQQQTTLDAQSLLLLDKQKELDDKQLELDNALIILGDQQKLLDDQSLALQEQQVLIISTQTILSQKEDELATAKLELQGKQTQLDDATLLLQQQQQALSNQQVKLDNLVGVKTKIIQELSLALSQANLSATVDKNTGDIVLESTVFFDVGKNTIKDSGRELLDRFIPVYLGVLLRPEYSDYLGEIIIEGHTDTQGDYLPNLELSQERALSVATYCLQMPGLTGEQAELLRAILTAKGRSFSDPVYNTDGTINMDASRRVEFKFRLKDTEMIDEIRDILTPSQIPTERAE
ncbi:MAG: OmpA family protein [Clostridiales bacterium]|nr:OmpA family protein [Clostridiales bacterium]